MLFRLRCHFCGSRSKHSKGTEHFECTTCAAQNFFDQNGNVADPPSPITAGPPDQPSNSRTFETFTRPVGQQFQHQSVQPFCAKCLNNQRMYMETVSNYLPDEDHPDYRKFEKALPKFKRELDKRYPQVCTVCAPKAQEKMYHSDYTAMSDQAARVMRKTQGRRGRSPVGERDDWRKWSMRFLLSLVGMMVYASLLVQVAWHAYGILATVLVPTITDEFDGSAFAFDPNMKECAEQSLLLRFTTTCYETFGSHLWKPILLSAGLSWYHHGLKDWWHNTYRMEFVHGQHEHLRMQLFLQLVRYGAWYKLSNPAFTASLTTQQLLGAHAFMIFFMIVIQRVSERPIKAEIWRIKGKIMPLPSQEDVFGKTAGPADEAYARQASSIPPVRLFARDERPFPIENLAPKPRNTRGYSKLDFTNAPPSPPDSQSVSDDGDEMDIDWQPSHKQTPIIKASRTIGMPGVPVDRTFRPKNYGSKRPQTRSIYNHGTTQPSGWGAMRHEIFDIQDNTREADERKRQEEEERSRLRYEPPVEQSPFRGRLPPAPMSMERKLRNPPTQVSFKKTPLSKQQDFMRQMREGIENGRLFGRTREAGAKQHAQYPNPYENDEDFSPAKSRTRGELEVTGSGWQLPGDGQQETGLEDLFGGRSFTIDPKPPLLTPMFQQERSKVAWRWVAGVGALAALVAVGWNIEPVRRTACLWLAGQLDDLGY